MIGIRLEEDWRGSEDWRRTGGWLEKDWRNIWGTRGGLDEDWRGIVGGLEENWRKDPSSVQLNELNGLDEMTIGRHHIDFASRFPPRQLGPK